MFCNGLFNAYSMGIGGGFFMTLYLRETGETVALDARETAPAYAHPDMYGGDTDGPKLGEALCLGPGFINEFTRRRI